MSACHFPSRAFRLDQVKPLCGNKRVPVVQRVTRIQVAPPDDDDAVFSIAAVASQLAEVFLDDFTIMGRQTFADLL
jgi:hypothetical protein